MRQITWELADGFPLDQGAMKFLQDESFDRIKVLASYWGSTQPETDFIIVGMEKSGSTINPGWCWIADKLLYYPGGAYPGAGAYIRPVLNETEVEYQDGIDRPALKYWAATVMLGGSGEGILFDTAGRVPPALAMKWSNLADIPADIVFDANYNHTDNNFTDAYREKLEGIEDGAEVNVQADWNQTDENHDSFIRNKPTDLMLPRVVGAVDFSLYAVDGTNPTVTAMGDIYSASSTTYNDIGVTLTITHPPVADGLPVFYFESIGSAPSLNAMIDHIVTEKTDSTMKVYLKLPKLGPYAIRINLSILK